METTTNATITSDPVAGLSQPTGHITISDENLKNVSSITDINEYMKDHIFELRRKL